MGRKKRTYYDGAIYHVIQRGNNKAFIYEKQLDKVMFLNLLKETMQLEGYKYKLLYYVIMDNHFHIIVETPDSVINVSRIFHRINMLYTRYYNNAYERCGSLYGGRSSIILIEDAAQLMQSVKYIAYNPVRAGIVNIPEDYKWSSHTQVVSLKKGFVDANSLLTKIHNNPQNGLEIYKDLIDSGASERGEMKIKSAQFEMVNISAIVEDRMKKLRLMLWLQEDGDEMLLDQICAGNRNPRILMKRKDFIKNAYKCGFEKCEIAEILNMSIRGVGYVLESYKNS